MPAGAMNLFRSRVDVFEAINRCEWQKVKDAVVPGKVSVSMIGYFVVTLLILRRTSGRRITLVDVFSVRRNFE